MSSFASPLFIPQHFQISPINYRMPRQLQKLTIDAMVVGANLSTLPKLLLAAMHRLRRRIRDKRHRKSTRTETVQHLGNQLPVLFLRHVRLEADVAERRLWSDVDGRVMVAFADQRIHAITARIELKRIDQSAMRQQFVNSSQFGRFVAIRRSCGGEDRHHFRIQIGH